MLVNPVFARWINTGLGMDDRDDDVPEGSSPKERFAAYEQIVAGRTNSIFGAGRRLQVPWPRALGTPPWGARNEIEFGASDPMADYDVAWFRVGSTARLDRSYAALRERVADGRPALLYIGNAWTPRHVVLVMPPTRGQQLDVYEPSVGRVLDLPREAFVARRLRMAGWDVPWGAVWADRQP